MWILAGAFIFDFLSFMVVGCSQNSPSSFLSHMADRNIISAALNRPLDMARRWALVAALLTLIVRLYALDSPLLGIHAWKQTDAAAVAKNFYEEGMQIWLPRVDWRARGPGFVEMEFPLFSYVVACGYWLVGGVHEWIGRLLAAVGSSVGAWYLVRLLTVETGLARSTNLKSGPTVIAVGAWAGVVYALLPLNIYYGRAFMPDGWMVTCGIAGLYYFAVWTGLAPPGERDGSLEDRRAVAAGGGIQMGGGVGVGFAVSSCVWISLACLLKLPALCLGLPLAYLAWSAYGWRAAGRWQLYLYGAVIFLLVGGWYWHAHQLALKTGLSFGIFTTDKLHSWRTALDIKFWYEILFERLAERHATWAGFVLVIVGVFIRRSGVSEFIDRLVRWWVAGLFVYVCIVARGNQVHEYYQLPFTGPICYYIAKALASIEWRALAPADWPRSQLALLFSRKAIDINLRGRFSLIVAILFALVLILSVSRYIVYLRAEQVLDNPIAESSRALRELLTTNAAYDPQRVVVVSLDLPGDPTPLYHARAKGWALPHGAITPASAEIVRTEGAQLCLIIEKRGGDPTGAAAIELLCGNGRVVKEGTGWQIREIGGISGLGDPGEKAGPKLGV